MVYIEEKDCPYPIMAFPIVHPFRSKKESQGLMNPLPLFAWCFNSFTSSGTAPVTCDVEITEAYKAMAVEAEDILTEL
jgi:hypothetical protein